MNAQVCQHEFANLSLPCEGRLRGTILKTIFACYLKNFKCNISYNLHEKNSGKDSVFHFNFNSFEW